MPRVVDRPEWRLLARLPAYRRKVSRTLEKVQEWLNRCHQPYVSVSGGKDSTVCLSLVRTVCPDITAAFFDDEWQFPETESYLATIPTLIRLAHPSYHAPGFTAWDYPEPPAHLPPGTIWTGAVSRPIWLARHGFDGAAIGIRASENQRRKVQIRARGCQFQRKDNGVWQFYPVADWSTADIWTYIAETKTPYNAAYDVMETSGVALELQRIGPIWTDQSYCGAEWSRRLWPALWRRFVERYPNAAAAG